MKSKPANTKAITTQKSIGAWTVGLGRLLLFAIMIFCFVDLAGMNSRSELMLPLGAYLIAIFVGVAMQFFGAAIPNMRFKTNR